MSKEKNTPSSEAIQALLGDNLQRRWWQSPTVWMGVATVVLAAGGYAWWSAKAAANAKPLYVTEVVKRGDLALTVSANGTLQPTRTVNIGSELSGTVRSVLVDVNDRVKKGQVLVELDTAKLDAQLGRSRANLAAAQAGLGQAQATLREAQASMQRLQEVQRISGGQLPSAAEMDTATASLDKAKAGVESAKAAVADAKASLVTVETDLSKAAIKSPIDGVVLSRSVDPGNAVAASLQAVTLFMVAEDLSRLRLEVAVDEADVGSVQQGQSASFTVSAYPARNYPANVTRVDYGATKTDNVVTYVARLDVQNDDLSLRPGMTASATINATERKNVLLVPNAALRFTPATAAGPQGKPQGGGLVDQIMPRGPARNRNPNGAKENTQAGQERKLWVLRQTNGQPEMVPVRTGLTDGRMTEILVKDAALLKEGDAVITDQRAAGADA